MVKCCRLMVCGAKGIGKSSMLNYLKYFPTIEDTFIVHLDKELGSEVRLYDTEGLVYEEEVNVTNDDGTSSWNIPQNIRSLVHAMDGMSYMLIGIKRDEDDNTCATRDLAQAWKNSDKNISQWHFSQLKNFFRFEVLWNEISLTDTKELIESFAIFVKEVSCPPGELYFV